MEKRLPSLNINDFNYALPDARIAKYPLERGKANLLVNKVRQLSHSTYEHLAEHLPAKAHLIFNETKVVQARLLFPKNETTLLEVFCLEPAEALSVEQAMQQKGSIIYQCLIGGARKWKSGALSINLPQLALKAEKLERHANHFEVRLSWEGDFTFGEVLDLAGKTPLPPYLNRAAESKDKTTYQTVYASRPGSVAAPTAGLHFNDSIFKSLAQKGIERSFLTLHVGAGTFKPVTENEVSQHKMHAEEVQVEPNFLRNIAARLATGERIIPVGTTSLRALESMYWLACLLASGEASIHESVTVPQWVGFENKVPQLNPAQAFNWLLAEMEKNELQRYTFYTQLIIAEGYPHKIISGLITNFHQPKSTLLLLIASLLGPAWRDMYNYALHHNFRFLSYGDGCLILPYES